MQLRSSTARRCSAAPPQPAVTPPGRRRRRGPHGSKVRHCGGSSLTMRGILDGGPWQPRTISRWRVAPRAGAAASEPPSTVPHTASVTRSWEGPGRMGRRRWWRCQCRRQLRASAGRGLLGRPCTGRGQGTALQQGLSLRRQPSNRAWLRRSQSRGSGSVTARRSAAAVAVPVLRPRPRLPPWGPGWQRLCQRLRQRQRRLQRVSKRTLLWPSGSQWCP